MGRWRLLKMSQQQVGEPGWDPGLPDSKAGPPPQGPYLFGGDNVFSSASVNVGKSGYLQNTRCPHLQKGTTLRGWLEG